VGRALPCGGLATPFAAGAAPQTSDQQGCINDVNNYGVRVAKSQNRADVDRVKNAGRGLAFRLGVPPQPQTAQACLTNDVRGRVAKDTVKLQDRETRSCLAEPGQLPGFGYSGSATAAAAARAAGLGIVAGLFGPDLDASIVLESADHDGARCQSDVLRYAGDLFYATWKEALTAKKNVLKGSARLAGSGPVASATDLEAELIAVVRWKENYNNADGFEFNATFHDQGAKTVVGVQIPPNGGIQDGLTMIDFLAHHPSTASFISRKLVIRFVAEIPPQRLVDEAAGVFLGSGGDIRAVLETILLSPEFLTSPQYRHAKVRRPLVFYAGLARAYGADPAQLNSNTLRNRVADMGEDLYDAGPPTGYPDVSAFWLSPGTAVKRFNDAEATSRGSYGFTFTYPVSGGTSAQVIDGLASYLFLAPISSETPARESDSSTCFRSRSRRSGCSRRRPSCSPAPSS
jgi:Protein of unknown function (DUF1800)